MSKLLRKYTHRFKPSGANSKLESQNEKLNLKIKQLEKKFGDERFKSLEETFDLNPD
jgi:hypothetical protein